MENYNPLKEAYKMDNFATGDYSGNADGYASSLPKTEMNNYIDLIRNY